MTEQEPMTGADPWKCRSSEMRCSTCIWFVPKFTNNPVVPKLTNNPVVPPNHKIVGRCRRHAPTMNGYPVVYKDDWCGDHRIDENKV